MDSYEFFTEIMHITEPALLKDLTGCSRKFHCRKDDRIIDIGEIQNEIFFMESGAFRGYLFLDRYQEAMAVYARILYGSVRKHRNQKMALLYYNTMQRYEWFLKEYADIAHMVKLKHIASFLGMCPETLIRHLKSKAVAESFKGNCSG